MFFVLVVLVVDVEGIDSILFHPPSGCTLSSAEKKMNAPEARHRSRGKKGETRRTRIRIAKWESQRCPLFFPSFLRRSFWKKPSLHWRTRYARTFGCNERGFPSCEIRKQPVKSDLAAPMNAIFQKGVGTPRIWVVRGLSRSDEPRRVSERNVLEDRNTSVRIECQYHEVFLNPAFFFFFIHVCFR